MVVDIGGGTVDITVHDNSSGQVSVILPPMGNTWGGTTINEALSQLLEELVQDKGFASFFKSDPTRAAATLNKLCYKEFEDEKKIIGDAKAGTKETSINLPQAFIRYYKDEKFSKGAEKLGMEYDPDNGSIVINYSLVEKKIFQFTVDGILDCVRAAFKELDGKINTVYLVGGFGGCKFVRQKIEEAISEYHGALYDNIVCPQQSDLAVVHGAVMWRKDPSIIRSRAADATYGIAIGAPFNPSIHDEHYQYVDQKGTKCCGYVFEVFVLKGEEIKDEEYKTTVIPRHQSLKQVGIKLYSTVDDGVQYTIDKEGEPTVHMIGELLLDIPNPDDIPANKRHINIFIDFSGTEIQARAQYHITGKEVKIVCDFLSHQGF